MKIDIKDEEVLTVAKTPQQLLVATALAKLSEDEIAALGIDLNAFHEFQ